MKTKLDFVLLLALGTAMLNITVAAHSTAQVTIPEQARVNYLTYDPSQDAALLLPVDWDDHRRCAGDHDRDDRHCYWRGRDDDRYRTQYYSRGNGYYGNAPGYGPSGWYDQHGHWHNGPDGWYDRKGKWHSDKHRHGDDR
jgi:hypothetical protein